MTRFRPARLAPLALVLGLGIATGLKADAYYGEFLAARSALRTGDFAAAATYLAPVIAAQPDDPFFNSLGFVASAASGDFDRAVELAQHIKDLGENEEMIGLVLLVDAARRQDWAEAEAILAGKLAPLRVLNDVFAGWVKLGEGDMTSALADFDGVIANEELAVLAAYQKALALGLAGDLNGALALLSDPKYGISLVTRRGRLATVQVMALLGQREQALDFLKQAGDLDREPGFSDLARRIEAGEPQEFTVIKSPAEGLGEAFFAALIALEDNAPRAFTLTLAHAALELTPDNGDARLILASRLLDEGRAEEAEALFAALTSDRLNGHIASFGRADAMMVMDRPDEAIAVLQALAASTPDLAETQVRLADIQRRQERFGECADALDRAIDLLGDTASSYPRVWFTRGICRSSSDNWTGAESDFRKSLELKPDQASVLNYLGYSLVERREKYDEALAMIERAASLEPTNGAILDSLGWALYRPGRHDEALVQMERAILAEPTDSVVNDHLGDVYWMVGRRREAEFQWHRALSFEPEPVDLERIRRKLDVGLDAVLAEESAKETASGGDL